MTSPEASSTVAGRASRALEILGYTVAFTSLQVLLVYFVFKLSLFEKYRYVYDSYFFFFSYFYKLLITVYSMILGDSILNNPVFYGMFMRMFFILFVLNLIYFIYRHVEGRNETS
ncbi:hypothetical protein [Candidatus Pyrohabitans sp.]